MNTVHARVLTLLLPWLALGCATTNSASSSAGKPAGSSTTQPVAAAPAAGFQWELAGTRIIGCCCTAPCPCRINEKPSYCHGCHYTEAVHVDRGEIDGVKVDGLDWVFVGRGFGEDKDAMWSYAYVCDRASEAQQQALGKLFQSMGEGLAHKAPYMLGKGIGMRVVPIQYTRSADHHEIGVKVADVLEFKTKAIFTPNRKEPVMSTGVLDSYGDRFVHADAVVHKLDDKTIGRSFELAGRQANQADFAIDSKRVARGGIGWGCWSAHQELGDKRPYPEQMTGHDCCDGEAKKKG